LIGHDMAMLNLGAWEITAGAAKYSAFIIEGGAVWGPVTDKTVPFIQRYKERWEKPPEAHTTFGFYDAVYMYKKAVERAVEAGEEDPFSSKTLIPYLEKFDKDDPYKGTTGFRAFTQPGAERVHELVWGDEYVRNLPVQWMGPASEDGMVIFWPPEVKTGEFTLPPWINTDKW
ncbi:hypothetical protein AKJ66_01905, partial [candidate division MSBL1 archaeon SCGC-AAA259E22]